jgi:lysozyme
MIAQKRKTGHTRKKSATSRHRTLVRHKRPNWFICMLQRLPRWTTWIGGGLIAIGYMWAFYYFFVGPSSFRWKALYGDVSYPEGYEIHGIDISHYQGEINWDQLREAMIERCPVRFIVIKATEGSNNLDASFKENFYQSRENGFIRGAYHFWSTKTSAEAQAQYFLKQVRLEDGDLPPILDVEKKGNISKEQFKSDVLTWLRIVEKHYHVKPIIYTYYKFKMTYLNDKVFDQYPYWIAHYYVDKVEYKGKWKFWQHTDCGRLLGIKGYVDFDIYNGSYYDLRKLTIGNHEQIGEDAYDNND